MPKTPVDMPDNLPKTPKPDINRPTPKTIPGAVAASEAEVT
jgi:hypothetical protein